MMLSKQLTCSNFMVMDCNPLHFMNKAGSLFIVFLLATTIANGQAKRTLSQRIIVKTNILSLIAKKPTLSIEKFITKDLSAEASFVQGEFNNFFLTDHYKYQGFLLRVKKFMTEPYFGSVAPYAGLYGGTLHRTLYTEGSLSGWGSISRDFKSNSIRGGVSLGVSYNTLNHFNFDAQASVGYGRYPRSIKNSPAYRSSGYLDTQIWLSVGYSF